jgi:hypothetical protein
LVPFWREVGVGNAVVPTQGVFVEEDPEIAHAQGNGGKE